MASISEDQEAVCICGRENGEVRLDEGILSRIEFIGCGPGGKRTVVMLRF